MTWTLNLDRLELCPGMCGRTDPHNEQLCVARRRLCDGTFYEHPRLDDRQEHPTDVPALTVAEWRARHEAMAA